MPQQKQQVRIELGEPVIIAQATPGIRGWGYYQFPEIETTADGGLHARYHVQPDSARAYGLDKNHAISVNDGQRWDAVDGDPGNGGLLLANGDRVRVRQLPAVDLHQVALTGEPLEEVMVYRIHFRLYQPDQLAGETQGWALERLPAGVKDWRLEMKSVDCPGELRVTCEGVLPRHMFWRMRLGPDNTLWGISYEFMDSAERPRKIKPVFFTSKDNGQTFQYISDIPYIPDPVGDPLHDQRLGYTEPDLTFLPDGSVFCLLRTSDGHGIGPTYQCRSVDGGKTWSKPAFFDTLGVWPTLLTLANGVTLASYGRPGLYLRATASPSGADWDERVTIVPPQANQADTCSYSDMAAIGPDSLFLIYSDFNYPDTDGIPVKSIMGRKIIATSR